MEFTFEDDSEWDMFMYIDMICFNCGRQRVCICSNGFHRCEKCNWVQEHNTYCEVPLL